MSAIRQDWPRKEIIAVDDASTDGSWPILEELAKQHQIVLLRHEHNKGVACARNTLLGAAQGEFIAYFDDDDESYPHRLSKQWERIAEYRRGHGCEQVFCTAVRNIAINGQIHHQSTALGQKPPEPYGKMVADYLLGIGQEKVPGGLFGTCVLMANVSLLRELGGFDLRFRRCAEWDLAVRGAFWGVHFIAVDEPLIVQHKTRGAEKAGSMPLRYSLLLREKHKEYLKGRRLYWASRAMARSNFHGNKGRIWKSRGYTLLACLISPRFFYGKLARKLTWPLRVAA
jgi:glycosyltransferase involved in cell wall biosynthesis